MSKEFVQYKIPESWTWTTLGEIGLIVSGGTPSTKERQFWDGEIPWITPADLSGYSEKYISKGKRSITTLGLNSSSAKLLPEGSIVFSSRAPIGYVAITKEPLATNQGFKNLILTKSVSSDYVYYYLSASKHIAEALANGTTFLEISGKSFSQIPIPLPPLNEQYRIVEKIEELFSDVDNTEQTLRKAQKQLELYKLSTLKNAFAGKLTEQWRVINNLLSTEEILEQLNNKREIEYKKSLELSKSHAKDISKKTSKAALPILKKIVPLPINEYELPNIPDGWFYTRFDMITSSFDEERKPLSKIERERIQGTYPYYGATEIIDYINKFIFDGEYLLIGEDGANLISKSRPLAFIVKGQFWVNNHAHIVKVDPEIIIKYLCYYFNTLNLSPYVSGSAQPKLNKTNLNRIPIPICSLEEQNQIVEEIESKLTTIENFQKTNIDNLKKTELFQKTILSKAFKGTLVRQELNDTSASELIQLIQLEKDKYLIEQKEIEKTKPQILKLVQMDKSLVDILKDNVAPMDAKDLWLASPHKNNIEDFYAELKKSQDKIIEVEKGKLSLKK